MKIENTIESLSLLTELMSQNGLTGLEFETDDFRVKLEKNQPPVICPPPTAVSAVPAAPAAAQPAAQESTPAPASGKIVVSPIVGTFYSRPAPDKAAFVQVGSKVKKGDVLMVIESMKLMNEIQSPYDGTIADIMVADGTAVDYDQPIMRIE